MPRTIIHDLNEFGQSTWLDYISCSLIKSGRLNELIEMGVSGITSNPTIFNKAISTSADYDEKIAALRENGKSTFEIYDYLTIQDIQDATDAFMPVYKKTGGGDGYVSLEINPMLAMDIDESIKEGLQLYRAVSRPNVMIKVPATEPGYRITEELLAQGVNVNATLIFSLSQYWNTVWAYFKGMNKLSHSRDDLSGVRSVASVFVSRIDTAVDNMLAEKIAQEDDQGRKEMLQSFLGKAAVANSKMILEKFNKMFSSDLFSSLSQKNAGIQRVLWASTSTKNPQYSDIKYITELISKPTVNTMPEKTLDAFLDHGVVKEAFAGDDSQDAQALFSELAQHGIDIDTVCDKLLFDGVAAFEKSFSDLINSIEAKARSLCTQP